MWATWVDVDRRTPDSSCLNERFVCVAFSRNGLLIVPMERGGSMWAGTTEERIELAVLLAFRWNEMFIVVGCGVAVQSCRGRVVWPRCLAGEEEEEWGDAFAGGWVRWYVPAWLARSLDVAGRRPLGSFRWNGSRSRPAWVRPSRRGGVPAERRSCRLGSSRSHGTTLPGWVGWLAPVGLGWFAGSGGVTSHRIPATRFRHIPASERREQKSISQGLKDGWV